MLHTNGDKTRLVWAALSWLYAKSAHDSKVHPPPIALPFGISPGL